MPSSEQITIKAHASLGAWRRDTLNGLEQMLRNEQVAGRSLLTCPHCGKECATPTVLGSHISQAHAPKHRPSFSRVKHSIGGRSRCSGCKVLFSSWARLCKHIEHGACPFPVENVTGQHGQYGQMRKGRRACTTAKARQGNIRCATLRTRASAGPCATARLACIDSESTTQAQACTVVLHMWYLVCFQPCSQDASG